MVLDGVTHDHARCLQPLQHLVQPRTFLLVDRGAGVVASPDDRSTAEDDMRRSRITTNPVANFAVDGIQAFINMLRKKPSVNKHALADLQDGVAMSEESAGQDAFRLQ